MAKTKIDPKKQFIIPVGGTLGILAYGYRGVMMWRQVRHEVAQNNTHSSIKKPSNEKS